MMKRESASVHHWHVKSWPVRYRARWEPSDSRESSELDETTRRVDESPLGAADHARLGAVEDRPTS